MCPLRLSSAVRYDDSLDPTVRLDLLQDSASMRSRAAVMDCYVRVVLVVCSGSVRIGVGRMVCVCQKTQNMQGPSYAICMVFPAKMTHYVGKSKVFLVQQERWFARGCTEITTTGASRSYLRGEPRRKTFLVLALEWKRGNIYLRLTDVHERCSIANSERHDYDAGWSSLVARRAHNPEAVGSNPAPATKFQAPFGELFLCAAPGE